MVRNHFILIFVIIFSGCSIQSRKDQAAFREFIQQKQWDKAEAFLKNSSLKKDEENKLLYLMELGNLYFRKEYYSKSARIFVQANELVDKLYTKSVKELVASSIINENQKTFYGSLFERSQLYYFQALSFYNLYMRGEQFVKGKEDKDYKLEKIPNSKLKQIKSQVRSTLIAWDSFYSEMIRSTRSKTFLKRSFLAKQLAASLHQALGTRRDKEIAYQLKKDAYDILIELGPTLKIFNEEFKNYNGDLVEAYNNKKSGKSLTSKKLSDKFIETRDKLAIEILSYAKRARSTEYKRLIKKIRPNNEILKQVNSYKAGNVIFVLQEGLISPMVAKDYSYNLRSAIDGIESPNTRNLVNAIGVPVITYFALGPLGLGFASHHGNVSVYSRHSAGEAITKEVGIEFELPYSPPSSEKGDFYLLIKSGKNIIKKKKLAVLGSLSDTSFIYAQELISNSFTKRATRVGIKYLLAIIAAYKTYETIKESSGELFAKPAAIAQFLISQKGIKETEKADVRYWTSLPDLFLQQELRLKPGNYDVEVTEVKAGKVIRQVNAGSVFVRNKPTIFSYNL